MFAFGRIGEYIFFWRKLKEITNLKDPGADGKY
jgi:hypothetical protein